MKAAPGKAPLRLEQAGALQVLLAENPARQRKSWSRAACCTRACALVDGAIGEELPGWRELLPVVRGELYADAAARGGVISGEHGIGQAKKAYLEANLGKAVVETMRAVKRALDPQGILTPGKIFEP